MAKKDFSTSLTGVDAFFSGPSAEAPAVEQPRESRYAQLNQPMQPVVTPIEDEPAASPRQAKPTYIFTLHLPKAWKTILADTAWERRTSVTGLLVEIIGDWLREHKKI